jgi:hypothetical protein
MRLIPDDELERLAADNGSDSHQAIMLEDLRARRAFGTQYDVSSTSRSTSGCITRWRPRRPHGNRSA